MTVKSVTVSAIAIAESIPDSLVALVARVAASGVFWRSGQTKIDGLSIKDSTFFLFEQEYMVPLLPPGIAAYLATVTENVCSVLLIVGLASRVSAAALLAMTAVIQIFVYPGAWTEHVLWASALLIVIARGPGVVSLDHWLFGRKPTMAYARA